MFATVSGRAGSWVTIRGCYFLSQARSRDRCHTGDSFTLFRLRVINHVVARLVHRPSPLIPSAMVMEGWGHDKPAQRAGWHRYNLVYPGVLFRLGSRRVKTPERRGSRKSDIRHCPEPFALPSQRISRKAKVPVTVTSRRLTCYTTHVEEARRVSVITGDSVTLRVRTDSTLQSLTRMTYVSPLIAYTLYTRSDELRVNT